MQTPLPALWLADYGALLIHQYDGITVVIFTTDMQTTRSRRLVSWAGKAEVKLLTSLWQSKLKHIKIDFHSRIKGKRWFDLGEFFCY